MHLIEKVQDLENYPIDTNLENYIGIYFFGGIGNQLFQFATAIRLAEKYNYRILLDDKLFFKPHAGNSPENYRQNIYRNFTFTSNILFRYTLKESPVLFDNFPEIPPATLITDYFQDYRYFEHIQLNKYFFLDKEERNYLFNKFGDLSQYTSLHIRRGDYFKFPLHHPILDTSYYQQAIEILKCDKLLVCSDDISWCKKNLPFANITFCDEKKDYLNIFAMSMCKNNIIANSTFSWWSAYLNQNPNKQVIAPKKWFGIKVAKDCSAYYLPEWIII